jgi:hypothetical protein
MVINSVFDTTRECHNVTVSWCLWTIYGRQNRTATWRAHTIMSLRSGSLFLWVTFFRHLTFLSYFISSWCCTVFQLVRASLLNDAQSYHSLTPSAIHMGQALKYKLWWMIPTATFAGFMEVFGWSARLWSSQSPELLIPYEMQWVFIQKEPIAFPLKRHCCRLVGTILAPTPLLAAIFVILGRIISQLGTQFSRLTPNMCWCYFDILAQSYWFNADTIVFCVFVSTSQTSGTNT